jgi:UTP--glucose-1-phosphate uridylyltransferase
MPEVDPGTAEILELYGFDSPTFERLRAQVASGELSLSSNRVRGALEPLTEDDLLSLPERGTAESDAKRSRGVAALRQGAVAQVVLAGGMATRFGGVVKGIVEVLDGRSFLECKLADTSTLAEAVGTRIPVALMTSFATDADTRAHVGERGLEVAEWFSQSVSLRLTPGGDLFCEDGRASPYAPGHGDLLESIRASGTLAALRDRGVETIAVSNVDNLGARIDPVVVGAHLEAGRLVTIEVANKEGDLGGAPVRVDGRPQTLEAPQFPPEFDQALIPVFNTNTALIDVAALERGYDLSWLYVEKDVGGEHAVQLERLYHHISAFVETTFLVVPRSGPRSRFVPIKTPEDLEQARPALRELLGTSTLD